MPKPSDVMLWGPEQHHYEVSRFLTVKPAALGILEILIALLGLGLTIWRDYFLLLWSPISIFLTGVLTTSAAHKCKLSMVRFCQILSYVNTGATGLSIYFHFSTTGVACFLLLAGDLLSFTFSVVVALTLCPCFCKPKIRSRVIHYINEDLSVNGIVIATQAQSSTLTQTANSVVYMLPSAPLQNSRLVHVEIGPPPAYDEVCNVHSQSYCPIQSAPPPPPYQYEDLQTR